MSTRRDTNKDTKRKKSVLVVTPQEYAEYLKSHPDIAKKPVITPDIFDSYAHLFDNDLSGREFGQMLMNILALTDVPRMLDGWVECSEENGLEIVLYTRTGTKYHKCECKNGQHVAGVFQDDGPCYSVRIREALSHPLFLRCEDDTFDSSYAKLYFDVPGVFREELRKKAVKPINTSARWDLAVKAHEMDPNPTIPESLRTAIADILKD